MIHKTAGFTLLEITLTLFIMSALLLFSVPLLTKQNTFSSPYFVEEFQFLIDQARLYALEHRKAVRICPSQDFLSCHPDWNNTLIAQDIAANTIISWIKSPEPATLSDHHFGRSAYLEFSPESELLALNGHFKYCQKERCTQFILNRVGHLKIESPE